MLSRKFEKVYKKIISQQYEAISQHKKYKVSNFSLFVDSGIDLVNTKHFNTCMQFLITLYKNGYIMGLPTTGYATSIDIVYTSLEQLNTLVMQIPSMKNAISQISDILESDYDVTRQFQTLDEAKNYILRRSGITKLPTLKQILERYYDMYSVTVELDASDEYIAKIDKEYNDVISKI